MWTVDPVLFFLKIIKSRVVLKIRKTSIYYLIKSWTLESFVLCFTCVTDTVLSWNISEYRDVCALLNVRLFCFTYDLYERYSTWARAFFQNLLNSTLWLFKTWTHLSQFSQNLLLSLKHRYLFKTNIKSDRKTTRCNIIIISAYSSLKKLSEQL